MENGNSREPAPPLRRAIIGALVGALSGALGAIFARPLLGAFRDSARERKIEMDHCVRFFLADVRQETFRCVHIVMLECTA